MRPLLSTALLLALLVPTQRAAAQPAPTGADVAVQVTVGKALLTEGQKLMETGRMAEARDKLEASVRHDPSLPALLLLADCQARLGATASAWGNFHRAEERARILGDKAAAEEAAKRAAALEPGLTRVRFEVQTGGASAAISLDGQPLPESAWGTAIPIDPGRHKVTAFVGHRAFSKDFELPADGATTVIRVPGASPNPQSDRPILPPTSTRPSSEVPPLTTRRKPRHSPWISYKAQMAVGITLVGLGCASGVAGYFVTMAAEKSATRTAGLVMIGAAVPFVAVGAAVALTAERDDRRTSVPRSLRVSPMVAQGGGGLSLQLEF